jgi:hypothetical protein
MFINDDNKTIRLAVDEVVTIRMVKDPLTKKYSFLVKGSGGIASCEHVFITDDISVNGIKFSTD